MRGPQSRQSLRCGAHFVGTCPAMCEARQSRFGLITQQGALAGAGRPISPRGSAAALAQSVRSTRGGIEENGCRSGPAVRVLEHTSPAYRHLPARRVRRASLGQFLIGNSLIATIETSFVTCWIVQPTR